MRQCQELKDLVSNLTNTVAARDVAIKKLTKELSKSEKQVAKLQDELEAGQEVLEGANEELKAIKNSLKAAKKETKKASKRLPENPLHAECVKCPKLLEAADAAAERLAAAERRLATQTPELEYLKTRLRDPELRGGVHGPELEHLKSRLRDAEQTLRGAVYGSELEFLKTRLRDAEEGLRVAVKDLASTDAKVLQGKLDGMEKAIMLQRR